MLEEQEYLQQRFAALLGPLAALMDDPLTTDLMVNPDGRVFVERTGEMIDATGIVLPSAQTIALIETLAKVTGSAKVNEFHPALEARVPLVGWRVQGLIPPVVSGPLLSIRKPAKDVYPLANYVETGRMTERQREALSSAAAEHMNIVVVGGTGSGKTTLSSAILHEVHRVTPNDRIAVIEDTPELQCSSENLVQMQTTPSVDMHKLLRWTLRLRPDRIVVGEVRGAEALVVLKSWSTGHPGGITTLHANGAPQGLDKLEKLAAEGTGGFVPRSEVAAAVQVVVYCERRNGHRRVMQIIRVNGLGRGGEYVWEEIGT